MSRQVKFMVFIAKQKYIIGMTFVLLVDMTTKLDIVRLQKFDQII